MPMKIMQLGIGVLCLVLAMKLGFPPAKADVNQSGWGNVVAVENDGGAPFLNVLTANGEYWFVSSNGWQLENPPENLPIPVNEIAFWSYRAILSTSGDAWIEASGSDNWINLGPPGDDPTPSGGETFSDLKTRF